MLFFEVRSLSLTFSYHPVDRIYDGSTNYIGAPVYVNNKI